ncbi:MAG: hypothetical protein ACYC3S_04855 [Chloroflexota bacterium]
MLVDSRRPSRVQAAQAVGALLGMAAVFLLLLVRDWSDNAYLYLAVTGQVLVLLSVPFVLAALLPYGWPRRVLLLLGFVLLWVFGTLGVLLLLLGTDQSLVYGPSGIKAMLPVLHLAGAALLAFALYVVGYRLRP